LKTFSKKLEKNCKIVVERVVSIMQFNFISIALCCQQIVVAYLPASVFKEPCLKSLHYWVMSILVISIFILIYIYCLLICHTNMYHVDYICAVLYLQVGSRLRGLWHRTVHTDWQHCETAVNAACLICL